MSAKLLQVTIFVNFLTVLIIFFAKNSTCVPFIVQSLSSNYGLVLGGYGPGYEELREVEVVRHNKVCPDVVR